MPPTSLSSTWQQQAQDYREQGQYAAAAQLYEQAISVDPTQLSHYWHLGLLLLLQGQEEAAQMTWLCALSESVDPEPPPELLQLLHTEATRRGNLAETSIAWAIRQHLREFCPADLENNLHLVQLAIALGLFTETTLAEMGLTQPWEQLPANLDLVQQVLQTVLETACPHPDLLEFVEAAGQWLPLETWLDIVLPAMINFGYTQLQPKFAVELAEQYLRVDPDNLECLGHLASLAQNAKDYDRGIQAAKRRYELTDDPIEKLFSNYILLRGLLGSGGHWSETLAAAQHHEILLEQIVGQLDAQPHSSQRIARLLNVAYYLVYIHDRPQRWRTLQNQLMAYCQKQLQAQAAAQGITYSHQDRSHRSGAPRKLRIGYLSHCMATHSVGWLARWLIQHHDRAKFDLYGYFINYRQLNDPLQQWYLHQFHQAHTFGTPHQTSHLEIANQIYQDEIDILVDLDSITLDLTSQILALKPAPIQVSWLGWDASGLPAIDYYFADPYVLPDTAQTYYQEKIWRLPHTYIAVDGFEVGVPTLRRDHLNIPQDAVVFLSAQRGYKRHPNHVKLQLDIIRQVPNSYLLIKGLADATAIQAFFLEMADVAGVEADRLRFLPDDPSVEIHRANLAIADVVLDTFPYNGATTTLETLWMGIPIVTQVGEQFAARNSYTMIKNCGITAGIAWTDQEYINWGIQLGTDQPLREQIHHQLLRSRQTAALWNAKRLATDMENAYMEMYERYCDWSQQATDE